MKTNYYAFIYSPGPNWLAGQPIFKQPLDGHFKYMGKLEAEGKLILGGGFIDGAGAMGVLEVATFEEAFRLVANDPAIKDGIVTAEIHPWYVTVVGQIEKSS